MEAITARLHPARRSDGRRLSATGRNPRGRRPGPGPQPLPHPTAFVIAAPIRLASDEVYAHGARLITAGVRRLSSDSLDGRAKTLNYLNSILAKQQANAAGADEALLLNHQGYVAEGTADNLFVVRGARC